jgi:hypothetical protein
MTTSRTEIAHLTDGTQVEIVDRAYVELSGWRAGEVTLASVTTTTGRIIAASRVSYVTV